MFVINKICTCYFFFKITFAGNHLNNFYYLPLKYSWYKYSPNRMGTGCFLELYNYMWQFLAFIYGRLESRMVFKRKYHDKSCLLTNKPRVIHFFFCLGNVKYNKSGSVAKWITIFLYLLGVAYNKIFISW